MATRKKEKVWPAIPERTETITVHVCDVCGKDIHSGSYTCRNCGRDMCGKCFRHDPEQHGDHLGLICDPCFALYNSAYRHRLWTLEADHENAEHALRDEWRRESLASGDKQLSGEDVE